jgi:hypothetical protein
MNDKSLQILHNTPLSQQQTKLVTVTHPHHALYGQQFEFVGLRKGKQQVVVIQLPRGNTARLPVDYTDYGATLVTTESNDLTSSENLLSTSGLLEAIKLVDAIKNRQHPRARRKSKK